jgi:hypothetical protein
MTRFLTALALLFGLASCPSVHAAASTANLLGGHSPVVAADAVLCNPAGSLLTQRCPATAVRDFVLTSVKTFGAVGDGVTDDTAAWQAAISSGLSFTCPAGVYKISANLLVQNPKNDGQVIAGTGAWGEPDAFDASTGGNACIIRPTSAVTKVFTIDGTPFTGGGYQLSWVQGFTLQDLVIDMVNMTDDASHVGVNTIQAWESTLLRVRVVHDGVNKRGYLASAGSFTSSLYDFRAHIVDFEGNSGAFGVTTMNIIDCDCGKLISNYAGDLLIMGGAFQNFDGSSIMHLRNTFHVQIHTDIEGNGTYLDVDASDSFIDSRAELQGFSGAYKTGSPNDSSLWDQQANYYASPACQWGSSSFGFQINGCGTGSNFSTMLSGSLTNDEYLSIGRVNGESFLGIAGEAGWWDGRVGQGDLVLGTITAKPLWLLSGQTVFAEVSTTGFNTFGTGTLNEANGYFTTNLTSPLATITYANLGGATITPSVDGQDFTLVNAAGSSFMLCNSAATIGNSFCSVGAGADWRGFSDAGFGTQTYDLDAATGNATFTGTITAAKFAGALNGSVGATTPSTVAATTLAASTSLSVNSKLLISATAPTYSSGFSAGTPTITGATTAAFLVTIGATPGSTGVLTMPAAATGWVCLGSDQTTAAGTIRETASATNSVTFALASTVASDKLQLQCVAY